MEALAPHLTDLEHALAGAGAALVAAACGVLGDGVLSGATDDDLLRVLSRAARLGRLVDGLLVEAVGQVRARCEAADRSERMSTAWGCRDSNELVRRATRCSARRAAELQHAAAGVRRRTAPTSGDRLPAAYPALRAALAGGEVAAEALSGVFRVIDDALPAATVDQRLAADAELAAAAAGTAPDGQPPAGADDLRLQAQVWAMVLDPDGAEPRDDMAQRRRELRLGRAQDGLVSIRGRLLLDVAAQLQLLCDAHNNPRRRGPRFAPNADAGADSETEAGHGGNAGSEAGAAVGARVVNDAVAVADVDAPPDAVDRRTVPQLMHDAFAAILTAAAGSADTPTLGGAAPTLTVAVRAEDLQTGTGYAHIDGVDEPVPAGVARHVACCGNVERVTFGTFGRVLDIQVRDRIFTPYQRRAIALRDGGCIIPGCPVRAAWCEIHHVQGWAHGGKTTIDDGVALCWFHHRTIETNGWQVLMIGGVPHVRGPSWWDPARRCRPANKHPVWMRRRVEARRQ